MVTDEQAALRRLVDKDSIVDLVHRYSYCVDHRLYDEVVELFTEDCTVDYGPGWPPVRTRCTPSNVQSSCRRVQGDEPSQCECPGHV